MTTIPEIQDPPLTEEKNRAIVLKVDDILGLRTQPHQPL